MYVCWWRGRAVSLKYVKKRKGYVGMKPESVLVLLKKALYILTVQVRLQLYLYQALVRKLPNRKKKFQTKITDMTT